MAAVYSMSICESSCATSLPFSMFILCSLLEGFISSETLDCDNTWHSHALNLSIHGENQPCMEKFDNSDEGHRQKCGCPSTVSSNIA